MELRKLRDRATEAFTKGRFGKAAELYQEYCEADPRDIQAKLRMGDAWAKAGERHKAIGAYKTAAEAFAREGFLPRAIAASKLILELDPSHQGVQQMLADLYARKGGAASRPPPPKPEPVSRREAIELPDEPTVAEESRPPEPIELPPGLKPALGGLPSVIVDMPEATGGIDLPPELQVFAPVAPAAAAEESAGDEPLAAALESPPPEKKPKPQLEIIDDLPEPIPVPPGLSYAPVAPVQSSRIFIPGGEAAPAIAPLPRNELARPGQSELQRAFSRFDELSLDDAPDFAPEPVQAAAEPVQSVPEAPPAASPPPARLPSFTELELEGDSLLYAVEVAAMAGQSQRGEDAPSDEEEEVFSLTAEVGPERSAEDLPKIPLFSDLPPDAFIELFDRCPLRRYGEGERVIAQGSVGDAFYVVCEGEVRVVREEAEGRRELATLKDGAFFGEMALLSGAPRSATVESASADTQLLEISAPVLAQLSHRYPQVATALKRFCRQRMLANVMQSSPLFRPFSRGDRRTLIERFKAREAQKGATLIREGQESDGLYVLLSGEVEVTTRDGHTLARLHEGEVFGEMSLLKKAPASATVTATRRTSLLRLPRQDFDALILSHPQILMLVAELTDDRQRATEALLSGSAQLGEEGLLLV